MQAYEIYQKIEPTIVVDLFRWLREEDRNLYKSTLATLANDRKLRPVFVQKKSIADQISWMHQTLKLKSSNLIGEHLFQVYFMQGQQKLLVAFCDLMGIEHDGKGSVTSELPESFDTESLKNAVNSLIDDFNPKLVALYLHIFNLQSKSGWDNLTQILAEDERLNINNQ